MTLQLRTKDNLASLIRKGESPAWKISETKYADAKNVEIVNWDGTIKIVADINHASTWKCTDVKLNGRLVVAFDNPSIEACNITWAGQNPVRWINNETKGE